MGFQWAFKIIGWWEVRNFQTNYVWHVLTAKKLGPTGQEKLWDVTPYNFPYLSYKYK